MNMEINEKTVIDVGFRLSRRFTIDHLTCGAYNGYFGRKMPVFRSDLDFHDKSADGKKIIAKWKIAANLKQLCERVLEPLTDVFGTNLLITNVYGSYHRTNIVADESRHLIGSAVDFTVLGHVEDMYYAAKTAYAALRNHNPASFRLVYGDTSWIHVGIEPKYGHPDIGKKDFGVSTLDLLTGEVIPGELYETAKGERYLVNQDKELFDPRTGQFLKKIENPLEQLTKVETGEVFFARPRGPVGDDWFLDPPTDIASIYNKPASDDVGFV